MSLIRSHLRWWLFVCATAVVMAVAGKLGFYGLLWSADVTYLGFSVIAGYVLTTAWIASRIWSPQWVVVERPDLGPAEYVADLMEKAGLLGTFIGLAVAFHTVAGLDTESPDFKAAIMAGVLTKLYASIVGLVGAMFLRTQIRILEAGGSEELL